MFRHYERLRTPNSYICSSIFELSGKMAGISHDALDDVSDKEDHKVIVDELLCFLCNKIDVLPPQTMADLCATSFDDIEIENLKILLIFVLLS